MKKSNHSEDHINPFPYRIRDTDSSFKAQRESLSQIWGDVRKNINDSFSKVKSEIKNGKQNKQGIKATQQGNTREVSLVHESQETLLPALPSASEMKELEIVHPGFADRVITMTEKQQNHLIEKNKDIRVKDYELAKRTQWFLFIIVISGLSVAGYGFSVGISYAAAIIATLSLLAGLIVVKISNKK